MSSTKDESTRPTSKPDETNVSEGHQSTHQSPAPAGQAPGKTVTTESAAEANQGKAGEEKSKSPPKDKKRKAEDSTNDPAVERGVSPPKKSRSKSPEPKEKVDPTDTAIDYGITNDDLDDPEKYWNRDPLSPLRDDDKNCWPGFRELQSEADEFDFILKKLGVKGAAVREVLGLDAADLAALPQPICGFLLCFKSRGDEETEQDSGDQAAPWFAIQTFYNVCGSNGLLNILMNAPDLDLGENLARFKDFTKDLTPLERGDVIGNYDFLRRIHNAGLRKIELLKCDTDMQGRVKANPKPAPRSAAQKTKKKAKASPEEPGADALGHYAAFIPHNGHVWKLDGLEEQPAKLEAFGQDEEWFVAAGAILAARMAETTDQNYSVLAVCGGEEEQLAGAEAEAEEEKLGKAHHDYEPVVRAWLEMLANKEGVVEELVKAVAGKKK